ncbi:hypothetical protein FRC07_006965 [Ceratobasidium sp. 392]|nr:hypothetical protein FRC07_006965 [Ceratobasidium sp. 392]
MDEQKRLMLAIGQSDDVAVGRIVKTALQNGAGIETIIDRIVKAQRGLYSPKNYSQKAFDLVALVLRVGGPRLAYAVSKALHLPSISSTERLDSGDCYHATEITMAALARFGQSNYNATVILASGTCKTEKACDQARWIELILNSWRDSPYGEAAVKSKRGVTDSAWSGLKALMGVLNESADMFPPFKSAVVGLWESVEIFEVNGLNVV